MSDEPGRRARRTTAAFVALYALVHTLTALAVVLRRDGGGDAALVGFPLDDSWIHHVYARSVAHGGLFEYVPGRPEAGFTSPLWVVLLAPLWWLTDAPHTASLWTKALGVLLGVATSVLADRLARRLSGRTSVGRLAGLAIALDPALTFSEVSGMEVSLAALLLLASAVAWAEKRMALAGTCLALGLASRPEIAVVSVWLAVASALDARSSGAVGRRALATDLARLLAPSAAVGAVWVGFCWSVSGRPLPNTFYAKHHPASVWEALEDAPRVLGPQLLDSGWFFLGSGLVLLALAARASTRAGALGEVRGGALALTPFVFLLGIAWAHDVAYVEEFCTLRYALPHLALTVTLVAVGVGEATALPAGLWPVSARAVGVVALLSLPLVGLGLRFPRVASAYAWNCQNIEEMQVAAGVWVRAHSTPTELIATHDAGAIRLFSQRRVLDLAGLNEHRTTALGYAILDVEPPRYFVIFPSWFPEIAASPRAHEVHRLSARHYTISPNPHTYLSVLAPLRPGEPLAIGAVDVSSVDGATPQ